MDNQHNYQVKLEWIEGRKGRVHSDALPSPIEVATPPEFAKGVPGIWSPEHLFVAAVNSCFMTTFLAIAENFSLDFTGFSCNAIGTLEQLEGKFLMSKITLYPKLVLVEDSLKDKALRVLEKSERACLISNSIHSTVTLEPEILVTHTNIS